MNRNKLFMLFAGLMLAIIVNVKAEDSLYIYTMDGAKTPLFLDEVKNLTFDATSMTINKTNGETSSYDFTGLKFFSLNNYDLTTSMLNFVTKDAISVFPNPVINELVIKKLLYASGVALFDLQGRKLMEVFPRDSEVKVSMDAYPSGVYFIHALS